MQQLSQIEIDQIALWYVLQYSLSSYQKLMSHFDNATLAIQSNALATWQQLKLHRNHLERLQQFHSPQGQHNFKQCLEILNHCCDTVLFHNTVDYPETLSCYQDSPPLLFVQGNAHMLKQPQIAMVGSRQPGPHGAQVAYDFAHFFAGQQFVVTSGLAFGIDAASHYGAIEQGQSIAIIGTGLDQCYPAEHQMLWQKIVATGGAIISEFLPNTPPAKQNFPRRNRIISGLSMGTLVVEAGLKSGSLITAKSAIEQGKQVFAIPGHIYSQYHQGCHHLIREGATLVDHPAQVIEDLTTFHVAQPLTATTPSPKNKVPQTKEVIPNLTNSASLQVPEHLDALYQRLDWVGVSIDELAIQLNQEISELNIALVELELLGLCKQHAGRYLRC